MFFSPSRSRSRRGGAVMIVVAAAIVVLLGCACLAVDYGVLLSDRNQLQRGVDAGSLAGAGWLGRTGDAGIDNANARAQAVQVALANNLAAGEVTPASVEIFDGDTKVRVVANRNRSLFFAGIFGISRGAVSAQGVAGIEPRYTPKTLPIGITAETFDAFNRDSSPRELTLNRLGNTDLIRSVIPLYDPFVLTDFRSNNGSAASPAQMERQLGADPADKSARVPIKLGDLPANLRASENAVGAKFKDGIGAIFTRAAAAPWNDPPTGAATQPWATVGTRFLDVQDRTIAPDNPRVVSLFVTDSMASQSGNYNYPVRGFAPVYIESVTETLGVLKMQVRFLDPTSGYGGQPVSLLE